MPEIAALGFDKMRSSIHIHLQCGREVSGNADERYRGGPENPFADEQLQDKVRNCYEGVLAAKGVTRLIEVGTIVDNM